MYVAEVISPQTFRQLDLTVDEDGFMLDQQQWSSDVAQQIAMLVGLGPLSDEDWRLIDVVRTRYFSFGAAPSMRDMCREMGVRKVAVQQRFGSCRNMWQIAGLPNPGEEMMAYMA